MSIKTKSGKARERGIPRTVLSQAVSGRLSLGKSCRLCECWGEGVGIISLHQQIHVHFSPNGLVSGIVQLKCRQACAHAHTHTGRAGSEGPRLLPRTITALSPAPSREF